MEKKDNTLKECIDQAERFLVLREHNERELKDKLRHKDYDSEIISQAIDFLKQENELSEERYIRVFIRSNNNRHPEGINVVLQRLAEKGADRTLSKEIALEIYTEEYNQNLASSLFEKLMRKTSDKQKIRLKMSQAGFSLSLINRIINSN